MNTESNIRPPLAHSWHHKTINTGRDLRACLRAGEYSWPGGYTCFFITSDGAVLSYDAVRENLANIIDSIRTGAGDGWRVVALECTANIDWEVFCDHTGEEI